MKKTVSILFILSFVLFANTTLAQTRKAAIQNGNKLYKEKKYNESLTEYNKALAGSSKDPVANYNLANAQFRTEKLDEAIESYDNTIDNSTDKDIREKSFYNKGVALSKQKKLEESIEAWKEALKINAEDTEARENLQKALQQQKQQQQDQQEKKDEKEKKENKKEQPKPEENQSKLSKQKVEQLLKALQQKEKEIQQRMQKSNSSPSQQAKDW